MSRIDLEDGHQYTIEGVSNGNLKVEKIEAPDNFKKSWKEIKGWSGLNPNFRRRTNNDIKKRQAEGQGANSKKISKEEITSIGYSLFDVITPPYNLDELGRYYETSFANHAAVDVKVSNTVSSGYWWDLTPRAVSKMDNKSTDKQRKQARKKIESAKIIMSSWLDSLNDTDTFIRTLEIMATDLHSTGNGYLEVGRTVGGNIGYIGHIPASSLRVRRRRDGFCQIIGDKAIYFKNFGDKDEYNPITNDPNPNEIIHFKLYTPVHSYYGVPDAVAAGQALLGDIYAQQYNLEYFQNKSVPRYIVTVKGAKLSSDSEEKLFDFLQTNLKGQNHRTLYIPLPADDDQNKVEFNMEAIEAGVQEASFERYHISNRNDVLTAHQVPQSKLGVGEGSLAGTIASNREFREQVSRPSQRAIEKILSEVIKEVTDMLEFKLVELTLTDEAQQAAIFEKYARNQIMTPNEIRAKLDMPPIEGGDSMIELNPKQAADAENERSESDDRARDREDNSSDDANTVSGRNPKGEGRSSK